MLVVEDTSFLSMDPLYVSSELRRVGLLEGLCLSMMMYG